MFPEGVHYTITRDYGATANQKISDLIASLGVAIVIVVALIWLTLGWRAALVVALAVPVCYGITLMLDYAAGYTINRVTLFALILALGLLVDDPITGVDNIERHLGRGENARQAVIDAIIEIRTPLIMSTIAVVIVFIPMSFITGMMGPYMSPMAFNVPVAVISSTLVAFLVTPWLGLKLLRSEAADSAGQAAAGPGLYARLAEPLLNDRKKSITFLVALAVLFVVCALMPLLRVVPLKLLPYDNKNEFQLVIDMPEGATLEATDALARDYHVILEGILHFPRYGRMLTRLRARCPSAYFYYFEVSLQETLRRHATKPNAHEFGETELRAWYRPDDRTGFPGERVISESSSLRETVSRIMAEVGL